MNNRFKSFLWRLASAMFVAFMTFLVSPESIGALQEAGLVIPAGVVAVLTLIGGEVTKSLNTKSKDAI